MKKVVVAIDIQREYIAPGRMFCIKSIGPSLDSARAVIEAARASDVPVIHVRHLQEGRVFAPESEHSQYIVGFEPRAGEIEITKSDFSCFSNAKFASTLESMKDREIVVIGYGSTMCCLSTIVEGYHRGYKMTFVKDASAAKSTPSFDEETLHKVMAEVLAPFATIEDSPTTIAQMSR